MTFRQGKASGSLQSVLSQVQSLLKSWKIVYPRFGHTVNIGNCPDLFRMSVCSVQSWKRQRLAAVQGPPRPLAVIASGTVGCADCRSAQTNQAFVSLPASQGHEDTRLASRSASSELSRSRLCLHLDVSLEAFHLLSKR